MPELPEVETVRRDISGLFVGDTLRRLVVTGRRTVRRHDPSLLARIEGQELVGVARHGKFLCFDWGAANVLVAHLRMSGQLLAATAGDAAVAHTHAMFAFSTGRELRFVDPRTFGELFLASAPQGAGAGPRERVSELAHLGPDALAAEPAQLRAALAGRRAPLKSLLVDQRVLAGIGNIYADEICFGAGLRPDRPGGALAPGEVALLAAFDPLGPRGRRGRPGLDAGRPAIPRRRWRGRPFPAPAQGLRALGAPLCVLWAWDRAGSLGCQERLLVPRLPAVRSC